MNSVSHCDAGFEFPDWVPIAACRYLRHIQTGQSLRDLARGEGCHPSTVLRQVRKLELRRDDPLVDEALQTLGQRILARSSDKFDQGNLSMNVQNCPPIPLDEKSLAREARRILRRLCETNAVLALAAEMDKAVVVRDHGEATPTRTAVVERDIAQAFALKEWIAVTKGSKGRITTYAITAAGRAALKHYIAEEENRRRREVGMDAPTGPFTVQKAVWDESDTTQAIRPIRYNVAESPLAMLARRKGKDGNPFLESPLVQAGERFREDFELAQMGPKVAQNWERFMSTGDRSCFASEGEITSGSRAARDRILSALEDLGPGLGDIIMRCCCFLEGLETAEKRMGWSARSGKVVLRIALQRLRRHYTEIHGTASAMIG